MMQLLACIPLIIDDIFMPEQILLLITATVMHISFNVRNVHRSVNMFHNMGQLPCILLQRFIETDVEVNWTETLSFQTNSLSAWILLIIIPLSLLLLPALLLLILLQPL